MTALMVFIITLIDINARYVIVSKFISFMAFTYKGAVCIFTMSIDARHILFTFINVMTVEFIMSKSISIGTFAFVRSIRIDTNVRAIVHILTLINV
jgi:hypothetical protein